MSLSEELREHTPRKGLSTGGVTAEQLRSFISRIERLEEEKAALSGDIKEVYGEAKGEGYNTKIIQAGNLVTGANGRTNRYAQLSCNFPYNAAAPQGADSNALSHFAIGVDDGVNGLKVWYVGALPAVITVANDGDTVAFKISLADFNALIANAIQA